MGSVGGGDPRVAALAPGYVAGGLGPAGRESVAEALTSAATAGRAGYGRAAARRRAARSHYRITYDLHAAGCCYAAPFVAGE